jgi:MFS family permease
MLALCCLEGNVSTGMILFLNVFLGIINAFEMPARQAFLTELIDDKNDYCSALSVNSTIVNAARLAGPALAAIIISRSGEMLCFLVNAVSYLAVIVSLTMMKIIPVSKRVVSDKFLYELKEGFIYACRLNPIRDVLLLYGLVCISGWPCTVLMPAIAKDLLHGGAGTFSMLMTASGAGALIGALLMGSRIKISGMDTVIAYATALLGIGIIALSVSRNLFVSMAFCAFMGACMMMLMTSTVTFIQTIIEDGKQGRIMGLYTMVFTGSAPTGSYLAGELSSRLGTQHTLVVGGLVCVIGSLIFIVRACGLKISPQDKYSYQVKTDW